MKNTGNFLGAVLLSLSLVVVGNVDAQKGRRARAQRRPVVKVESMRPISPVAMALLVDRLSGLNLGVNLNEDNVALVESLSPTKLEVQNVNDQILHFRGSIYHISLSFSIANVLEYWSQQNKVYFAAVEGSNICYIQLVSNENWAGKGYYALEVVVETSGSGQLGLYEREPGEQAEVDGGELIGDVEYGRDEGEDISLVSEVFSLEREPGGEKDNTYLVLQTLDVSSGYIKEMNLYQISY